jgi:nucleoside-diphosphate-sugar epimerase
MKILVTGASGFIGRNILIGLPKSWDVTAIYRSASDFVDFLQSNSLHHVKAVQLDLCDAQAVKKLSPEHKKFDACIYLAANGDPALSVANPSKDLIDNTLSLINLLAETEVGHMVYFSSGAVYDGLQGKVDPGTAVTPLLPYAISKWASERYVLHAQKEGYVRIASIVRFFGAYGPYEPARKIYGKLVKAFAIDQATEFTIRGDGENLIDAMHVHDTVRAVLLILKKSKENKILDLYSGTAVKVKELVTIAANTFGIDVKINFVDHVPEFIEFYSSDTYMSEDLQFKPAISLQDGLTSFHKWISSHPIKA